MKAEIINRSYLETLSFDDLTKLADDYGIEVPQDLDRRFLIGELLEYTQEFENKVEDMVISSEEEEVLSYDVFPKTYNETQISCVLRNPIWTYVFWNISEIDLQILAGLKEYDLMLRICSLSSPDNLTPEEVFEIQVNSENQEQYVLLPANKRFIRVELVYFSKNSSNVLAFSPVQEIPQNSKVLNDFQPGKDQQYSEILELSGIQEILMKQFKNHRHSFS